METTATAGNLAVVKVGVEKAGAERAREEKAAKVEKGRVVEREGGTQACQ